MDYYNNGNLYNSGGNNNNDNRVNDFLKKLHEGGQLDDFDDDESFGTSVNSRNEIARRPIQPADNADMVIYNKSASSSGTAEFRKNLRSKSTQSSGRASGQLAKQQRPAAKGSTGQFAAQKANGNKKKKKKKNQYGKSRWWKVLLKVMLYAFSVMAVAICAVAVMLSIYLSKETVGDEQLLDLNSLKLSYATRLMAENHETGEWEEYQRIIGEENRIWVDYDEFPDELIVAIVASEDQRFFTHNGVDIKRTSAAMIDTILKAMGGKGLWEDTQGGSTITQQLIKNITEDDETSGDQGILRKVREIYRAYQLERRFTKDQILEAYLNTFRLSGQVAGIEAAANYYFGVTTKELTAAQCAAIICITKAPGANNPFTHPDTNKVQRDYILNQMSELGDDILSQARGENLIFMTDADYNDALEESKDFEFDKPFGTMKGNNAIYSYFTDTAVIEVLADLTQYYMQSENLSQAEAESKANSEFFNGGLQVYLTVDTEIQSVVEDVAVNGPIKSGSVMDTNNTNQSHRKLLMEDIPTDELERDEDGNLIYELDEEGNRITQRPKKNQVQSAIVVMDYQGRLLGVAGGIREKTVSLGQNMAVGSTRQTGSSMKPIGAYALALEYNYITYSTGFRDRPTERIGGRWWPTNFDGSYEEGLVPVATAIAKSLNTIAVQAIKKVGVDVTYDFLTMTLGISSLVDPDDKAYGPLALGGLTNGISPYEMCAAYAIFGNGGMFYEKHSYSKIVDWRGEVLINKEARLDKTQAISPQTSMIMNRLLQGVIKGGTGTNANPLSSDNPKGLPYAGKSGTSSDFNDFWFIGLNPYYVCAVWEGYEFNGSLRVPYGAVVPHPVQLMFKTVMARISYNLEYLDFPVAEGVRQAAYCKASGDLASGGCPDVATGWYKDGHYPPECQHEFIPNEPDEFTKVE